MRRPPLSALSASTALALVIPALPQRDETPSVDPYTEARSGPMDALGYEGFGPFRIGAYKSTTDADALITGAPVLWLETAHFKLGSQLPACAVPTGKAERAALRAELRALQDRLPRVRANTDELDRWLRLHLLASRCEDVYARVQEQLGVTDRDFPARDEPVRLDSSFMGLGPYLGQAGKFVVVVFDNVPDFDRFCTEILRLGRVRWPQRYNHGWRQSLTFVTCTQFPGSLSDDRALHGHLAYNVVYNLLDGYRHLCHETPVWFKTGLAQWHLRRIAPGFPNFDRPPDGPSHGVLETAHWDALAARLARSGDATPFAEMAGWRDFGPFTYRDYVVANSRVTFLLETDPDGLALFWHWLKRPIGSGRGTPDWQLVLDRQSDALREAFGHQDWAACDEAWRRWAQARVEEGAKGGAGRASGRRSRPRR